MRRAQAEFLCGREFHPAILLRPEVTGSVMKKWLNPPMWKRSDGPLMHRRTKGTATDRLFLRPHRHIFTLRFRTFTHKKPRHRGRGFDHMVRAFATIHSGQQAYSQKVLYSPTPGRIQEYGATHGLYIALWYEYKKTCHIGPGCTLSRHGRIADVVDRLRGRHIE